MGGGTPCRKGKKTTETVTWAKKSEEKGKELWIYKKDWE